MSGESIGLVVSPYTLAAIAFGRVPKSAKSQTLAKINTKTFSICGTIKRTIAYLVPESSSHDSHILSYVLLAAWATKRPLVDVEWCRRAIERLKSDS